jgi:hypothetical protein
MSKVYEEWMKNEQNCMLIEKKWVKFTKIKLKWAIYTDWIKMSKVSIKVIKNEQNIQRLNKDEQSWVMSEWKMSKVYKKWRKNEQNCMLSDKNE